jgi:hypothetical protein
MVPAPNLIIKIFNIAYYNNPSNTTILRILKIYITQTLFFSSHKIIIDNIILSIPDIGIHPGGCWDDS